MVKPSVGELYNTEVRHGFAADYESEQFMSQLAEVCIMLDPCLKRIVVC